MFILAMLACTLDADTKPPEVKDAVLILRGPDKGRTGRLIGIIKSRSEGIVKTDHDKGVKLLLLSDIAKQLSPDAMKTAVAAKSSTKSSSNQ
jgi:hypothetical protein